METQHHELTHIFDPRDVKHGISTIIVKTLSYPVLFASSYFMVLLLLGHLNESRDILVSQTGGKSTFGG